MFIEKLTNEQICSFLNVPSCSSFMYDDDCLYVSYEDDDVVNLRFYDFEGDIRWLKFLYSLFGDDYLKEYTLWLEEIKEEKLKDLLGESE